MGDPWSQRSAYTVPPSHWNGRYPGETAASYTTSHVDYHRPVQPEQHQGISKWASQPYPAPPSAATASSHYTDSTLCSGISRYDNHALAASYTPSSAGATGSPSTLLAYPTQKYVSSTLVHPSSSTIAPGPKRGFKLFSRRAPITTTWYAIPEPTPQPPRKPNKLQKRRPQPHQATGGGLANRLSLTFGVSFGKNHTEPLLVRKK